MQENSFGLALGRLYCLENVLANNWALSSACIFHSPLSASDGGIEVERPPFINIELHSFHHRFEDVGNSDIFCLVRSTYFW